MVEDIIMRMRPRSLLRTLEAAKRPRNALNMRNGRTAYVPFKVISRYEKGLDTNLQCSNGQ